jgi:hypothetical protein
MPAALGERDHERVARAVAIGLGSLDQRRHLFGPQMLAVVAPVAASERRSFGLRPTLGFWQILRADVQKA